MFLLLLFERVTLTGDWGDTSPSQEAFEFFDYLHPELISKVSPILSKCEDCSINNIISKLSNNINDDILSLLNVTLQMKFFNPAALSRSQKEGKELPINKEKVKLRGWGLSELHQEGYLSNDELYKIISVIDQNVSFYEKVKKIAHYTEDVNGNYNDIINEKPVSNSGYYSYYPSGKPFSSVNGRVTAMDPHQVLEAIIQEYKTAQILDALNVANRDFLTMKPAKELHLYNDLCPHAPILEPFDIAKQRAGFTSKLYPNKDYYSFLRYKETLVDIQLFINVKSKMALPLLEYIRDSAATGMPVKFHIFMIGNLSKIDEKQAVTLFWKSFDDVGARSGLFFVIDALQNGLKKAFKRTQVRFKWRKLNTLAKDERIMSRVRAVEKYCSERNITDWAVSINGDFIRDEFPFETIHQRILLEAKRIQQAIKFDGLDADEVSFPSWFKSDSIPIVGVNPPLDISTKDIISLSKAKSIDIINALKDIHAQTKDEIIEESVVPVITINTELPNLSLDSTIYKAINIDKTTENIKKVFGEANIIIGPLVFNSLNANEIEYAIRFVNYSYNAKLGSLTMIQKQFIEMWRADASMTHQKRKKPPQTIKEALLTSRKASVTWDIYNNPKSFDTCPLLELMKVLANCKLVGVQYLPTTGANLAESIRSITCVKFHPAFTNDDVEYDSSKKITINRPREWELKHSNKQWTVPGVVFDGYISQNKKRLIKIGEEVKMPLDDGYFFAVLKPGYYSAEGFEEQYISVNSLTTRPTFYKGSNVEVQKAKTNDRVDFYSFLWNQQSYIREYQTAYTFFVNLSKSAGDARILILDPWTTFIHPNIATIFLPFFVPRGFPTPSNILFFTKYAKYYYVGTILPTDADNIIFCDESIVLRGDASRLARIQWKNAAACASLISKSDKDRPWGMWDYKKLTMGRPFHNIALICFKQSSWTEQNGSGEFIKMASIRERAKNTLGYGDDEYFNLLQLHVQIATLPAGTTFSSENNPKKYAKNALAQSLNAPNAAKLLGVKLNKLADDSKEFFGDL